MIRKLAALSFGVALTAGVATADPAHHLFTGQNMSAAERRIAGFACHNCHGRDGRGGLEGDVPEIAGYVLRERTDLRPAYSFEQFRDALTAGVDPSGRSLSQIMPRYDLAQAELALLWSYLQDLPHRQTKGVKPDKVRFGVVIDPISPGLGARYSLAFTAELERGLPFDSVYGRKIEVVRLVFLSGKQTW